MSSIPYNTFVIFIKDYPKENIKKGSVFYAVSHTDDPGNSFGLGSVTYKSCYSLYDCDPYYTPRGTKPLYSVDKEYCKQIYREDYLKEKKKENRINKLKRILYENDRHNK